MCRVLYRALILRLSDVQRVTLLRFWYRGIKYRRVGHLDLGIYDLESRYLATASDAASTPFSSADFCSVPFKCDSESFGG